MKRLVLFLVAAVALVGGLSRTAAADDQFASGLVPDLDASATSSPVVEIDDCASDIAGDCCGTCCSAGVFFEVELLMLQYLRTEGLTVGDLATEGVDSSLKAAPRVSAGLIMPDGLGARVRYFEFDQHLDVPAEPLSGLDVDTYTIDAELFERFDLNACWDLEASLGARYVEFDETMLDQDAGLERRQNSFSGLGLIAGLELRREVALGAVYGRVRHAILSDDITRINIGSGTDTLSNTVVGTTEINIGYELSHELGNGSLLYARIGGEYQVWSNFSSAFDGVTGDAFWDGASDVGFAGFSVTAGMLY